MQREKKMPSWVLFPESNVLFVEQRIDCFFTSYPASQITWSLKGKAQIFCRGLLLAALPVFFQFCFFGPGWRWWGQSVVAASAKLSALMREGWGIGKGVYGPGCTNHPTLPHTCAFCGAVFGLILSCSWLPCCPSRNGPYGSYRPERSFWSSQ